MKIFLPFKIQGIGGTASFARKFQKGMQKQGHEVFFDYQEDYDVLFLIVQAPFKYLIEAKRRKKKIIQRLDGVYYWSVSSWKYPFLNLKAAIIRHRWADFTVYQSEYSKYCAEKFLGKKRNEQSTIIYNGVDLETFSPTGEKKILRENPEQQLFFTASAFRRQDQIIPILEALRVYKKKYTSNFVFYVAGTCTRQISSILQKYSNFKNIRFIGKIENKNLPEYERSADLFLFTHLNPPCPNNIIEAMACGLPICGIADGAMPEIVSSGNNGLLLSTVGNAFYKKRSVNHEVFANAIHETVINKSEYSNAARKIAEELFSLNSMISKYIDVLGNLD